MDENIGLPLGKKKGCPTFSLPRGTSHKGQCWNPFAAFHTSQTKKNECIVPSPSKFAGDIKVDERTDMITHGKSIQDNFDWIIRESESWKTSFSVDK